MKEMIYYLSNLLANAIGQVLTSVTHNWLPLSFAILTAAAMKAFVNTKKLQKSLLEKPRASIVASVALGAFTPLCACGTMAVIIGLLTTALPWGPVMAFLTSSPLMSPDGFIMMAGIIGLKFTIALAVSSVVIGLGSGYLTHMIEKTGYLKNQSRFTGCEAVSACACSSEQSTISQSCTSFSQKSTEVQSSGCSSQKSAEIQSCGCSQGSMLSPKISEYRSSAPAYRITGCCMEDEPDITNDCGCSSSSTSSDSPQSACGNTSDKHLKWKRKWSEFFDALWSVGIKQILLFFAIFVAIGWIINSFVPSSLIVSLFRSDSIFSVPLAAVIGLPLYVSGESAVPLIQALMKGGAGQGAMLAFMITGPATSAWVITGISAFMKRRVILLYLGFILFGGILLGYGYDALLALGL